MSSNAPEHTLASLCVLVADCPHATPKWTDSGVIVLRNQNIKAGRLDLSNPSFTDEQHYFGRIRRAVPQAGDLVITREAPMGEVCQIPAGLRCCLGQRQVLLRPDLRKVDGRFLLFALQSPYLQHQIGWSEGTGSTVSNVRIPVLEALRVPTPPLHFQREVAQTLGALDDRVALQRETNATLEAIAKALFKSWFIDFDPVRARMERRLPDGMDEATGALFPDSFNYSELGAVPNGWKVGCLLDLAALLSGGTPETKRKEYWGGDVLWASAKDVSQSADSVLITTERTITPVGVENSATRVIPALATVVVARGATTGRMVILGEAMAMNQTCYALVSRHDAPFALALQVRAQVEKLLNAAHGSVFDTITTSTFAQSACVLPPREVLAHFESIVQPLLNRVVNNVRQCDTLRSTRDTLLPRLISGQLRVQKAAESLEPA
jgi:type I restriction enzyme, S subunit